MVITAAALASGQPALLFDEPFNGLDVEFRHRLRSMFIDAVTDDAAADAAITDGGDVVLPNTAAPERTIVLTSQHSQDLAGLVETLIVIHDHEPHGPFDVEQLRTWPPGAARAHGAGGADRCGSARVLAENPGRAH